jgi:heptosyltransferase II
MKNYLLKKILYSLLFLKEIILSFIVFLLFKKVKLKLEPKRIAVFRTALLGDFLFSIPSINILRKKYPDAYIVFVTTYASSKDTAKSASKYIDTNINYLPWFKFIEGSLVDKFIFIDNLSKESIVKARQSIKELNPDIFFLLPHPADRVVSILKKLFFFRLIGVTKNVFGWNVKADYGFLRSQQFEQGLIPHKIFGPIKAVNDYISSNSISNEINNEIVFPIKLSDQSEGLANNLFMGFLKNQTAICISIGATQLHKQWPKEKFKDLIISLSDILNPIFILIGTKGDIECGDYIEESIKNSNKGISLLNLVNKTNIEYLAAIAKRADLFIGNDGGGVHIAAAVNCKTVSIIPGLEFPNSIDPWGYQKFSVRHEVECSPCYSMTNCPLGHRKCMVDIPIEAVLKKSLEALEIEASIYNLTIEN